MNIIIFKIYYQQSTKLIKFKNNVKLSELIYYLIKILPGK